MAFDLDAAVALLVRVYFGLGPKEVCACGVHVHVHCMSMSACIERHTACDVALLRLSWPLRAPCAISFMLCVCLHRHRACARWSRLRSTRSQPSCFAADGAAPAITGGGATACRVLVSLGGCHSSTTLKAGSVAPLVPGWGSGSLLAHGTQLNSTHLSPADPRTTSRTWHGVWHGAWDPIPR